MPNTWLVTGSSSGFGRAVTESALRAGNNVVATLRKPSDLDDLVTLLSKDGSISTRLLIIKCDVTIPADIASAFSQGIAKFGAIDIVFNNAGYAIMGEVESVPDEAARKMFDVNFWGAANVSKEAVRVFREVNGKERGGWLLNNSSSVGLQGYPVCGHYAATKYALEGLTESLAKELDPSWNIKITLLEPGPFRTNAQATIKDLSYPAIAAYSNPNLPSHIVRALLLDDNSVNNGDVNKAADRIVEVTSLKNKEGARIPLHWVIHKNAVTSIREHLKGVIAEVDEFERWSDNLLLSDESVKIIGE